MSVEDLVSRLMLVPPQPKPPIGSRVLVIFRAAPNFFRYNMLVWLLGQLVALAGLVFALVVFEGVTKDMRDDWVLRFFQFLELVAWAGFIVQLPLTFMMRKLDYKLRWYIVTDRSLRIREGIVVVREKTMTFANIQNISIHQGPLQRFLGIADVEVKSAGGGASAPERGKHGGVTEDLHSARFRGVDNAAEIRDVIRTQVRKHRDSGLGDPDDAGHVPVVSHPAASSFETAAAARILLLEVRRLRELFREKPAGEGDAGAV